VRPPDARATPAPGAAGHRRGRRRSGGAERLAGNTVCTPEQFYQQPLNVGDSIIIDFGSHFVGYLQFSCRSVGSPPDAPAHLHFTFGETLSEVCEPFSEYQGWLSSSWLQQQDLWLDVLPARVDSAASLLPALPEGGGQSAVAQVSSAVR
jgi:hypothetical protein